VTRALHGINADLHCHSQVSDGALPPAEVARRASANGVEIWALTDHDEVGGLDEAAAEAARLGMRFVPGVEVSVTWGSETVHIVGLGIDHRNAVLIDGLARTRGGRGDRAQEMSDQLAAVGIPGAYEGALKFVGNPALISRTHFARFLVEQGHCRDIQDVFDRYLSEGRPGFVPHRWARLADAVGWIRAAGGIAVVAHPGRYRLDSTALWSLFEAFRDAGGEGIEVVTGNHDAAQQARFAQVALQFGFKASRGSDFHGPGESDVELGRVDALPAALEPIWAAWA
jgi:predicted metal-dependent phosphoesterase TrpH